MQGDPDNVFGGRNVYFTEDPDIKVVYCLVRKPDPIDIPEVGVTLSSGAKCNPRRH